MARAPLKADPVAAAHVPARCSNGGVGKGCRQVGEPGRLGIGIIIKKRDDIAARGPKAGIARRRDVRLVEGHRAQVAAQPMALGCADARGIGDNDNFKRGMQLLAQGRQGKGKLIRPPA
ncbi:MAG: hypothetical protein AAFY77_11390 [Pseudomonadota bacterium]